MAKCPRCNNRLPSFGKGEAVKSSSGRPIYKVCSSCKAILRPKLNKNYKIVFLVILIPYFVFANNRFPLGSNSHIDFYLYLIPLLGITYPLIYYFFTEYEIVDETDMQPVVSNKVQFSDYLRASGWLLIYVFIIVAGFFTGSFKHLSDKEILFYVFGGMFFIGLMFLTVYAKQKMKNRGL